VLIDDAEGRPLRRVRVFLESLDEELARTTISDDAGRFAFNGLRAARYTIGGVKEGYVRGNYGAIRTGGPGASVALGDGQTLTDIVLTLPRGATITGVLLDAEGRPIPGVSMRALRYSYTPGGERRLMPVSVTMAGHVTDDRGIYRIYGLAPGEYAIAAPVSLPQSAGTPIVALSEAEVRRALDEVRQAQRQQAPPVAEEPAGANVDASESTAVGYAPVFYPGTTLASQAALIPLAKGEERSGIDFQIQYVPMTTIHGSVFSPQTPVDSVRIFLIATADVTLSRDNNEARSTLATGKGEFTFSNVAPGAYTIVAKGSRLLSPGAPVSWATVEVLADGQSEPQVMLSLQSSLTVSGRISFAGRTPPPDATDVRVTLVPMLTGGQVSLATAPARVDASGRFTITGVTAARYRLQANLPGRGDWMLSSAAIGGRDALDMPIDLKQSVDGAVVTFTDEPGEISGIVRDGTGKPIARQTVVLFTTDRTLWAPYSRRLRATVTAADGRFVFRMVPPGEYGASSAAEIDEGEWFDPRLLERLTQTATPFTLAQGEKKSVVIRGPVSY